MYEVGKDVARFDAVFVEEFIADIHKGDVLAVSQF